ncbi:MAG: hypothetical protein QG652_232 [Pseudomonadota bacterium]|nr:hypothetical protein [Pseudomonadota bacterium]
MKKLQSKFHFKHYIYIFLAVAIIIFVFSGLFVYNKIHRLSEEFIKTSGNEAIVEVSRFIQDTIKQVDNFGKDFITWDEVHQQLSYPAYYGYWKEQRANRRKMPDYIDDIDLYNTNMEILGNSGDNQTKARLIYINNHYAINNNRLYYFAIFPIVSRLDATTSGYLLVKTDILKAINESGRLLITDISSIRIMGYEDQFIPDNEIMNRLQFVTRKNPLFDELLKTTTSIFVYGWMIIVLFIFAFYYFIKTLINTPLTRLTAYVERLKFGIPEGASNLTCRVYEFNNLKQSIDNYQHELVRINSNLDMKNDELWELAHHDPLTGAANRRAYEEDWKSHIAIAYNKRLDFSYMLIDCDHFKAINDTYGHDTGDKLITTLVNILHKSLRTGDKLYRIGGDEFVTILWDTDANTADKIAERCQINIRNNSFLSLGINEPVSISIGIATHTAHSSISMEALPRQADIAMYHAKKSGSRNIIHYHNSLETDLAPLVSNRIIDAVIRAANTAEGITIHYQPVINTQTLEIEYYEALLRIMDNQGLISAGEIFPVAEKLSLEAELDLSVLTKIKHDLHNRLLPEKTGVSINFSAALFSLPDLTERLQPFAQYLSKYAIVFEVTEKTLITDIKMVSLKLTELRQQGFQIALDDFGSGYSSIRYLANMPIDIVKFDISMTRQLVTEDKSRSIISGTAAVILNSGFKLVAEGIENSELQELVIKMGATHMQGYALGKPATLEAICKK